jgi:dihydroxyacetone kinase-like protein
MTAKRFANNIKDMVADGFSGFCKAHADLLIASQSPRFAARRDGPVMGKVALVSGGGSGHEPLHIGYVGRGMLDATCPGEIFTSPTPDQILAAAQAAHGGKGVLFIVKNYDGDVMNFEMAAEMLEMPNASLVISDEVVPKHSGPAGARRGMAGTVIIEKIVGAAAEAGASLEDCLELGQRINQTTRSMGVALTSCVMPAAAHPTFDIDDDEVELGVGIHGEPGRRRQKLTHAQGLIEPIANAICSSLGAKPGDQVLLHVNGFGGTPLLELYLVFDVAENLCRARGLSLARSLVGNYTTCLDMAGCSITLSRMDDELLRLWDAPVHTPVLRWGC